MDYKKKYLKYKKKYLQAKQRGGAYKDTWTDPSFEKLAAEAALIGEGKREGETVKAVKTAEDAAAMASELGLDPNEAAAAAIAFWKDGEGSASDAKVTLGKVVSDLIELNPHLKEKEDDLMNAVRWEEKRGEKRGSRTPINRKNASWVYSLEWDNKDIKALPESIQDLDVGSVINLQGNTELEKLPQVFDGKNVEFHILLENTGLTKSEKERLSKVNKQIMEQKQAEVNDLRTELKNKIDNNTVSEEEMMEWDDLGGSREREIEASNFVKFWGIK